MIIVPVKDGENIERALKKFKRKFDKTVACSSAVQQTVGFEAPEDGTRHLHTEVARRRRVKSSEKIWWFKLISLFSLQNLMRFSVNG